MYYSWVVLQSVVMVQFRDPAAVGDEMEAWRLWHGRQPSFKQRILDIGNTCVFVTGMRA